MLNVHERISSIVAQMLSYLISASKLFIHICRERECGVELPKVQSEVSLLGSLLVYVPP